MRHGASSLLLGVQKGIRPITVVLKIVLWQSRGVHRDNWELWDNLANSWRYC